MHKTAILLKLFLSLIFFLRCVQNFCNSICIVRIVDPFQYLVFHSVNFIWRILNSNCVAKCNVTTFFFSCTIQNPCGLVCFRHYLSRFTNAIHIEGKMCKTKAWMLYNRWILKLNSILNGNRYEFCNMLA